MLATVMSVDSILRAGDLSTVEMSGNRSPRIQNSIDRWPRPLSDLK